MILEIPLKQVRARGPGRGMVRRKKSINAVPRLPTLKTCIPVGYRCLIQIHGMVGNCPYMPLSP